MEQVKIVMTHTKLVEITEHWYMCIGCNHRCKLIGFKHPVVQGDSCGGTLGRRKEIKQLFNDREVAFNELHKS